jgi:hypothetical protein
MIITLPALLEAAWAQALPGREAAAQNEMLRAFQPCPLSGKPDIEPTPPNDYPKRSSGAFTGPAYRP